MPVVVSMLNLLWLGGGGGGLHASNDLLIVTGALVGFSGAIPVLHHVQGDEPLLHLRDRRWVSADGVASTAEQELGEAPRDQRRRRG